MLQSHLKNRIVEAFSIYVALLLILASGTAQSNSALIPDSGDASPAPIWEEIVRSDGIVVSQLESDESSHPTFRGRVSIPATPYEVLAVLRDVARHSEWMDRCVEARRVEEMGPLQYVVYNRTESGWPAADRDVVLRSQIEISEEGARIFLRFRAVEKDDIPRVEDVVRMETLEGYYHLAGSEAGLTHVEYRVSVDPGGSIPRWLIHRRMRDLPLMTLARLREQVASTHGHYSKQIDTWKQIVAFENPHRSDTPVLP